jgi:hypothetical protein
VSAVVILVVAGVALAILGFLAWLVELTTPIESSLRVKMIEYRKTRTLRAVRAEGGASRERIRAIMGGERRGSRPPGRTGHAASWIAITAFSALVLLAVVAATGSVPSGRKEHTASPSPRERLDAVVRKLRVGDCTNFTANFATHSPPANPLVVPCSSRAATFKVIERNPSACSEEFVSARLWSDAADGSVCMARVYNIGQCMQGSKVKNYAFSWYADAVVPCKTKTTRKYPYLIEIAAVLKRHGNCPRKSFLHHPSHGLNAKYLCVMLVARFPRQDP